MSVSSSRWSMKERNWVSGEGYSRRSSGGTTSCRIAYRARESVRSGAVTKATTAPAATSATAPLRRRRAAIAPNVWARPVRTTRRRSTVRDHHARPVMPMKTPIHRARGACWEPKRIPETRTPATGIIAHSPRRVRRTTDPATSPATVHTRYGRTVGPRKALAGGVRVSRSFQPLKDWTMSI